MRKKSKKAISSILVLFVLFQIVCPVSSYAIENGGQETQETTNESLVMDENTGKDEDNSAQDSSKDEENIVVMAAHQSEDYKYLSDLDYITENNWSYAGWGEIKKDKNIENGQISLLVDGTRVYFSKGMGAHASSQLTYDVSGFSGTYTRFVSKMGVDASKNGLGEVWFRISASKDGTNWDELYKSNPVTSKDNALDVDLNIKDYKYLRLYADKNGSNAVDHAVYADSRIVKENYDLSSELFDDIKKVSYYDEILSKNTVEENYNNHFDTVLKREFVNRMGYWNLQNSIKDDDTGEAKEAIKWIFNDQENLQLFIETGNVGDSLKCVSLLKELYSKHKDDLNDQTQGDVYKKMMIALAIAYSTDRNGSPLSFNMQPNSYDALKRYEIIKNLYDSGLFARKDEFSTYNMELIRMVMNDSISNDEIDWLRHYSQSRHGTDLNKALNPYNYMHYVSPNYAQDKLYDANNKETYDTKYQLSKYNIPYGLNSDGTKTSRTWMVMEAGGICWNISRLGQNLNRVYGIPTVGIYQPAHESYFTYSQNSDGKGIWSIGNNIFGWGQSSSKWYGGNGTRLLLNWNNKSFTRPHMGLKVDLGNGVKSDVGNNGGYQLLGQAALNNYEAYQKSLYYNLIANSYESGTQKEEVYNKALEVLDINLDSFEAILNLYKQKGDKVTSANWLEFAKRVISTYTYYPMAMTDLLRVINPYLNREDALEVDMLKTEALNKALNATDGEVLQSGACREIARELLGSDKVDLASFSFDGENAGKIVMNSKYDDYDFQVQYSLDGGNTWETSLEHKIVLSKKQIESITADNDIQVKISGSNQVFTIDILKGENISSKTLAMNDDEDSFVGKTEVLEYSIDNGKTWKAFDRDTRITGNQTVLARYRAHGVYLSGDSTEYNFTENNDKEKKYVYVKDISYISSGSSQSGYAAKNMIDASPFTTWHTTWGQVAKDKTYVVSFNEVKYLSQITYDPADGVNGRIKSAKVYVSLDGKEWTLAGEKTNMANNTARKELVLDESLPAKFVKIEATETYGNHEGPNKYVSGRRFNYYEDTTKIYKDPSIEYSVTSLTNKDVVATLQLPSGFKAVGESTYTFDKNGEHTFTYKDLNNKEKTIKAKVSWIDKEVPTATVEYDITEKTEFAVKATLKDFSKENVKVLNGDENGSHTFIKNGEFTFMIQDEAGNIGYVTAKVTWITAKDTEVDDDLYVKSDDYVVKDDVIKNIDANTSLEELKSKLNTNAKQFKLIKNGQEVDIISTGTILVLDNDRSYTLVVTGDINGDSYHNELDLTLLINHLLDRTLIQNEIESMASDMNDDGEIDIVDLSIMNKKTLN